MGMRLDPDIREVAEAAQAARREAREQVADQEIIGMRFMSAEECYRQAVRNLAQIDGSNGILTRELAVKALADVVGYGLGVIAAQRTDDVKD